MDEIAAEDVETDGKPPSELSMESIYACLRNWFEIDSDHSLKWRSQAKRDFAFVTPEGQWEPEEAAKLKETGRAPVSFNRTLAMVKAIAGTEINGRHDTVYLPRGTEPGAVKANELLSAASQWMADGCDAEDEQSTAFQDMLTCGMGWTEQRIAFDEDPDGKYVEFKVDPLEMYWDRSARSKNLVDARRVFRVRKLTLDEARDFAAEQGADLLDEDLDASWAAGADADPAKPVEERRLRDENSTAHDDKREVHIVHAQWIERQVVHRVGMIDPQSGQQVEKVIPDKSIGQFRALAKQHGIQYKAARQVRKVRKQCYMGKVIIGEITDVPARDVFTYQCITGERDRNTGTWFGIVAIARDPQKWANKWLVQTMHILNTTAKGGILAEEDAFADQRQAQDTYAQPDAITWVKTGAIAKNKIMAKPGVGLPTAYVNLIEFAVKSIPDVIGVNMELLGMRGINQPGVLEAQRKQSAMTILATLFDSMRNFRKNVGRVRLFYIQNYLADGRLILIAGEDGKKAVPLIRSQVMGEYQVIIDDAPTSPNMKQETWGVLMQMMPVFKDMMTVEAALAMLEYSPLPSKLVDTLKQMAAKSQEKTPEQKRMEEAAVAGAEAKVERDQAAAAKDKAGVFSTTAKGMLDLANAMSAGSQMGIAEAQAAIERGSVPSLNDVEGEYAVEPQQGAIPQVPQLPSVPTGPIEQPMEGMQ